MNLRIESMMNRRQFFSTLIGASAALQANSLSYASFKIGGEPKLACPTADQTAWQNLEIGMFIHFAPNTWQNSEYDNLSTPLSAINPDINTDQWADCAVKLGAKYILFVAKHVGGFCMWQTHTTNYGIRNTPWRSGHGDVMASLSASCRNRGLRLGVYLSPQDRNFGAGLAGRCKTPQKQVEYNRMYREQLTELLTRYGEIVEIWFDGSTVVPVGDILKRYAPHAMIFQGPEATIRWVGNEDGFAPYPTWNPISKADAKTGVATAIQGSPNGSVWLPVEADVSILRPYWFWSPTKQMNLLSLNDLIDIYYRSVGRGAQMVLNLPPDSNGLMPDTTCERAREFGEAVRRRFGHSIAETSGSGQSLVLKLPSPQRVDHVTLQEDCSLGQRVRAYRLEGNSNGSWVVLGRGTAIGHKRIQPVPPTVVEAIRFVTEKSAGQPAVRRFAAFDTGVQPPRGWNDPVQVWADDKVGVWTNHRFRIDLSKKIAAAAQYRLRFVAQGGATFTIEDPVLLMGGVPEPDLVRRSKSESDTLILTMTAVGQDVVIEGQIKGAESGILLLRRL